MTTETMVLDQPEHKVSVEITDDPTVLKIMCMEMIKVLNESPTKSRFRSLAVTKIEEVIHRLDDVIRFD